MQPSQPPSVIIVIGRPQSGKTTLRETLCQLPLVHGASCSEAILPVAARTLGKSEEYLNAHKETYRPFLAALGDVLVLDDAAWLAKRVFHQGVGTTLLPGVFVLDGVRRPQELAEFRKHLDYLRVQSVVVVWLERQRGPLIFDNTTVTPDDADVIVFASEITGGKTLSPDESALLLDALMNKREAEVGHYSTQAAVQGIHDIGLDEVPGTEGVDGIRPIK